MHTHEISVRKNLHFNIIYTFCYVLMVVTANLMSPQINFYNLISFKPSYNDYILGKHSDFGHTVAITYGIIINSLSLYCTVVQNYVCPSFVIILFYINNGSRQGKKIMELLLESFLSKFLCIEPGLAERLINILWLSDNHGLWN